MVKDDGLQMEWMVEEEVETDMDWCVVESREHAYLADFMVMFEWGLGLIV
jgi:hypothetical protein